MSTPASRITLLSFVSFSIACTAHASQLDAAIVAAMKLPEARSYHWIATIEDDARFYEIEGRTEKNGYTLVNMPMITSLRRKLGADGGGMQTVIFKGNSTCVIETAEGWTTPEELSQLPGNGASRGMSHPGSHGGYRIGTPTSGTAAQLRYSNLQLNWSQPSDEIGLIVGSYTDAHVDADGISGTLSGDGAKLLLVHPGQDEITPLTAAGTFKLWIKDGALVKYQVKLTGTIAVGEGPRRREISLHQNTTTEIRDVGTTVVAVPDEVKQKLNQVSAL